MAKIIFFDIDGTLVGFDGRIPESTFEALRLARQNGHRLIICTGRSRGQIQPSLIEAGFDGIVCAAGAYVEYGGNIVFHKYMERNAVEKAVAYFEGNHSLFGLQTEHGLVLKPEHVLPVREMFASLGVTKEKLDIIIDKDRICEGDDFYPLTEKIIYYSSPDPVISVQKALAPEMDVTMTSFEEPDETSGEVSTAGITKAYGMERLLEYLGAEQRDTIAFGDGPNDVEMMQYAKIGVAMGNAVEFLKQYAYMVTDRVENDGIMHAMQKLGLV